MGTVTAELLLDILTSIATDAALVRATVHVIDVPLDTFAGEQLIIDNEADTSATVSVSVEPFNAAET